MVPHYGITAVRVNQDRRPTASATAQEALPRGENPVTQAQAQLELRLVDLYETLGGG